MRSSQNRSYTIDVSDCVSDLPLSIPDIIQHHYDCIIQAEHEVFLATNFWQASKSATKICDALIELSKRAKKRGKKVIVKVMYDRANLKMIAESHLYVDEAEWTGDAVKMPKREEMPWVDFQLVNYHQCVLALGLHWWDMSVQRIYAYRPVLGTFHCKFMVVDRKMAILCSNNIQDRPNMEMMCHLEGPIVDSMYDTALISWYKAMDPPLPLLSRPYQPPEGGYKFGMENEYATTHILDGSKGEDLFRQFREKGEQAGDEDAAKTSEEAKGDGRVFIAGKYQTITDHISRCPRIHRLGPRS